MSSYNSFREFHNDTSMSLPDRPYRLSHFNSRGFFNFPKEKLLEYYKFKSAWDILQINEEADPEQDTKLVIDCDRDKKINFSIKDKEGELKEYILQYVNKVFPSIDKPQIDILHNKVSGNARVFIHNIKLKNKHRYTFIKLLEENNPFGEMITFDSTNKLRTVYSFKSEELKEEFIDKNGIVTPKGTRVPAVDKGCYSPVGNRYNNMLKYSIYSLDGDKLTDIDPYYLSELNGRWETIKEIKEQNKEGVDRSIFKKVDEDVLKIMLDNLDPEMNGKDWFNTVNALYNVGATCDEIHEWSSRAGIDLYNNNAKMKIDLLELAGRTLHGIPHILKMLKKTMDEEEYEELEKMTKKKVEKKERKSREEDKMDDSIENDINGSNKDMATLFYSKYKDICIMPDSNAKYVYIYDEGKRVWTQKCLETLLLIISDTLIPIIDERKIKADKDGLTKKAYNLYQLMKNLKSTRFLKDTRAMALPMFLNTDFNKLINSKKYILPFSNGTLFDFELGEFRPIEKEDYVINTCKIDYKEDREAIKFAEEYFKTVYDNDMDKIEFLLRFLGWCLMKDHTGFEFVILYGSEGSNSKDTLINMVSYILGEDFKVGNEAIFMKKNMGQANSHTSHLTPITNKKLVYVGEPEGGFNVEAIKRITGSQTIPIRRLGKDEEEIEVTAKFILSMNSIPKPDKKDLAFEKRLIVVESPITFNESFRGQENFREPDHDIGDKIIKHINGFLYLMMEGGKRWMKNRLKNPPSSVKRSKDEYVEEYDIVKKFCNSLEKTDPTVKGNNDRFTIEMLLNKFNTAHHCNYDKKQFIGAMKINNFITIKKGGTLYYYVKIRKLGENGEYIDNLEESVEEDQPSLLHKKEGKDEE